MNKQIGKLAEHTAAVKALAWSPHKSSLLATGGGSTDKTIKLWDTNEMICTKTIETGSQVCNMLFSSTTDELVSTHGYSLNSIVVWKTKTMEKLTTLNGHTYRVLYLARSPDEECILTGSGDQTLRFWKLFPSEKNQYDHSGKLEMKNFMIR
jgi:cell division cycle 20-like protein 1 (cofactor of APC complex)